MHDDHGIALYSHYHSCLNNFGCSRMVHYFCTPFIKKDLDLVAQLVEQYTFNVWALGSSPSGITDLELGH